MKDGEGAITLGELNKLPIAVRVGLGVVFALILVIYVFYPAYPTVHVKSLGGWTWVACHSVNSFLHGRLVPLIFPWLVWWALKDRKGEVVKPSYWGLVWIGVALLLFFASVRAVQPRWALFGVPFMVLGVTQYLLGKRVALAMIFPAFFWWFMIPLPWLRSVVEGNWQMGVTVTTFEVGKLLGMDLIREGGTITVNEVHVNIGET